MRLARADARAAAALAPPRPPPLPRPPSPSPPPPPPPPLCATLLLVCVFFFFSACNNSTKIIEPIQSRCAILRYARLSDVEVARRLVEVCAAEAIPRDDGGLEALVFTAEGDLRNGLNSLQSTFAGFGHVTADNVYRVCDTPHPLTMAAILEACLAQDIDKAAALMGDMWKSGYAALDVVTTLFKVLKAHARLGEVLKMELLQTLSATHMRVLDGVSTLVQMHGLCAKIAAVAKGRYAAAA